MKSHAAVVLCVVALSLGGVAMGEFKSPRDTAAGDVVSTWPAHQKAFEDSLIEATGQTAAVPFTGRILARLDDKGVANGIASLGADGRLPVAQVPWDVCILRNQAGGVMIAGDNLLPWPTEAQDANGFHAAGSTDIVIPPGFAGKYLVIVVVRMVHTADFGAMMGLHKTGYIGVGEAALFFAARAFYSAPLANWVLCGNGFSLLDCGVGDTITASVDTEAGVTFDSAYIALLRISS